MLNNMKIFISSLLLVSSMMANAESEISLSESKIKSRVGQTVSVDLVMSDFETTEGGGVNLHFNPKMVKVNSVVVDDSTWSFVNQDGEIDNNTGIVKDILFSSYRSVSGDAKIATIELEFVGKGKSKIKLRESGSNPFASNGEQMTVSFKKSKIRVRR